MHSLDSKICSSRDFEKHIRNFDISTDRFITFANPYSYHVLISEGPTLEKMDLIYVDGSLLKIMHNLFHPSSKIDRLSFDFTSLAQDVFNNCAEKKYGIALIGGNDDEITKCCQYLISRFPNLDIRYSRNGYFSSGSEMASSINAAVQAGSCVFIVGMGTPKQEQFISLIKDIPRNSGIYAFTCGGFITQTGIAGDYYHPLIKKTGLRWLQRFIMHPHVRKRVVKDYPLFLLRYIRDHLKLSKTH